MRGLVFSFSRSIATSAILFTYMLNLIELNSSCGRSINLEVTSKDCCLRFLLLLAVVEASVAGSLRIERAAKVFIHWHLHICRQATRKDIE